MKEQSKGAYSEISLFKIGRRLNASAFSELDLRSLNSKTYERVTHYEN